MNIKVVFTEVLFEALKASLAWDGAEKMAYILCHSASHGEHLKLIPSEVIAPSDEDYESRCAGGFSVQQAFADSVVNKAINEQMDLIQAHIHPGSGPVGFSGVDRREEPRFMRDVAQQVRGIYHGSIVFSNDFQAVDGWAYSRAEDDVVPVEKVLVVGQERLDVYVPHRSPLSCQKIEGRERMDRTIRAFGEDAVNMLGMLDVGVVGASALGGPVLEMLARDGFRSVTLCDEDYIEESNLNRLVGAGPADIERPKAEFYEMRVARINPDVSVTGYQASFYDDEVQRAFAQVDVVIGCVDSGARFSINNLTLAHCIPYFDMGAGIIREKGSVSFKGGHVISIVPGRNVCLHCSGMYKDLKKEFLPQKEIEAQVERGYIEAEEEVRPLVSHLDYVVAGMGYHNMLSYLWGEARQEDFMVHCDLVSNILRPISFSSEGCLYCQADGLLGKGDKVPSMLPGKDEVEVPESLALA